MMITFPSLPWLSSLLSGNSVRSLYHGSWGRWQAGNWAVSCGLLRPGSPQLGKEVLVYSQADWGRKGWRILEGHFGHNEFCTFFFFFFPLRILIIYLFDLIAISICALVNRISLHVSLLLFALKKDATWIGNSFSSWKSVWIILKFHRDCKLFSSQSSSLLVSVCYPVYHSSVKLY